MTEIRFVVRGTGAFPMDMLRYDCCYPATAQSATLIGRSWDGMNEVRARRGGGELEVTLGRVVGDTREGKAWKPTVDRWASFGWEVVTP